MYTRTAVPYRFRGLVLAALLPLSAVAAVAAPADGVSGEIASELAAARAEVRREMAAARAEIQRENLELGDSLNFGSRKPRKGDPDRPRGEITPDGDLLVDGKPVAIDDAQRRQLLAYRQQVIAVALAGMDVGEQAAQVALDTVDRGLFSLLFNAMTGRLERKLERDILASLEPGLVQLCGSLPALYQTQQALAADLPEFQPYATLQADDVERCESDLRREFARL